MMNEENYYQAPDEVTGQPILVPPENLQAETLRHLAVEFLLRETGNDVSETGVTEERISKVLNALKKKTHFITFDPVTESVGIMEAKNLALKHLI